MKSTDLLNRAKSLESKSFYNLFALVVENSEILKTISTPKRKAWISDVIEEIYHKQNGCCAICGKELEYGSHEVDHVIPHSYGGGNERGNLQLTCITCNRSKRNNVDPHELLKYLEDKAMNL
jgi:CRISPR/Cas system Type II protein with McrA/HNH and RuvC-like nuclease domain